MLTLIAELDPDTQRQILSVVGLCAFFGLIGILVLVWYQSYCYRLESEKKKAEDLAVRLKKAQSRLPFLLSRISQPPNDISSQNELKQIVEAFPQFAAEVYESSLDAVKETDGAFQTKEFALEIGRRHFGFQRQDGQPTLYDETAIRNDISARTSKM